MVSDQQNKWYFVLTLVYGIAVLVDWLLVPDGSEWQWVNFGLGQLKLAAVLGMAAMWSRHRWVHALLVVVWVGLAVIGWPRSL
ncbi:hypothetical protein [Deinococcus arenae]|uniref:hypothetical protein n=1 Tax=Deinococcus arenae TaxID=1452751 RepID=UPI000D7DF534|nr:hypothetical protein [Deinococcus arenae]AWT35743.1 hypothetical protein DM785_09370 [Deinococcus actinosclerus]